METQRYSATHVSTAANYHQADADHHFVQRVAHLPMVALTLSRLSECYKRTKLRHLMLKNALEMGEGTMLTSWDIASDIAAKTGLQKPLNMADSSACYFLTKVEEKLPIITYTPDEIVSSTKRIYDDTVKPRIDQLAHMKENTVQKYNDAKEYGTTKLSEAKHLGATTVKTVFDAPVTRVNQTFEWSLNTADSLVDKYLPEGELSNGHYATNGQAADGGNLEHAKNLSNKLRQRLSSRIADNQKTAQLLAQAFTIVDALKNTSAAHSLQGVWEDIRRLSGSIDIGDVSVHNVEQKTLLLVKNLTAQLKEKLEGTSQQLSQYLPQPVTDRFHQATDVAKDIFHQVSQARSIDDISQPLVAQVHHLVVATNTTMNSALDVLTETYLLKWLIPEYRNIGSLDIHMN